MRLDELVHELSIDVHGARDIVIDHLTDDSRAVRRGGLFVARRGTVADGRRFIADAVAGGAAAILTDDEAAVPDGTVVLRVANVARTAARLAERLHGHPCRHLRLVGVTGTNGKTTVCHFIRDLVGACGLIGTVAVDDGRSVEPARLTTPAASETSAALSRMVDHGLGACAMEVSSHALDQGRVDGLEFAGAVFTNLSGDHMDYHRTRAAYASAKARLFGLLGPDGFGVVNVDDAAAADMIETARGRIVTTSARCDDTDAFVRVHATDLHGTHATWRGPWGDLDVRVPVVGAHNAFNLLQAMVVAHAIGVEPEQLVARVRGVTAPPGRLEPVADPEDGIAVLVDYAHTDDALDNVLRSLRPAVPGRGRLWVVFGCGGDRDRTKRPRMARAAWRHADEVVVTSDNPRTEDPTAIVEEVMTGVPKDRLASTRVEVERAAAIEYAVRSARIGDVVVIAGKGHEDYQIIGNEQREFDDRVIARLALGRRRIETRS